MSTLSNLSFFINELWLSAKYPFLEPSAACYSTNLSHEYVTESNVEDLVSDIENMSLTGSSLLSKSCKNVSVL